MRVAGKELSIVAAPTRGGRTYSSSTKEHFLTSTLERSYGFCRSGSARFPPLGHGVVSQISATTFYQTRAGHAHNQYIRFISLGHGVVSRVVQR